MAISVKRRALPILVTSIWLAMSGAAYGIGHARCTDCHIHVDPKNQGPGLVEALPDLCLRCHAERIMKGEHPSEIQPGPTGTGVLPLVEGLISCTTCHDPHSTAKALLRLPSESLCGACHDQ